MKNDSIIMLALACLTAGAVLGHYLTPVEVKTRVITITQVEQVPEYITEVEYVPQPYEVIKEVEVVKEMPVYPQWFDSEEEMADLLARLKENRITAVDFSGYGSGACIYYSKQLAKTASRSGYLISVQSGRWTGNRLLEDHELCSTWIGKNKYFIEPQTLEYELVYNTDKGWVK